MYNELLAAIRRASLVIYTFDVGVNTTGVAIGTIPVAIFQNVLVWRSVADSRKPDLDIGILSPFCCAYRPTDLIVTVHPVFILFSETTYSFDAEVGGSLMTLLLQMGSLRVQQQGDIHASVHDWRGEMIPDRSRIP